MITRTLIALALVCMLAACGRGPTGPLGRETLTVLPATLTLAVGDSTTLYARTPLDGSGSVVLDRSLDWMSEDPAVVLTHAKRDRLGHLERDIEIVAIAPGRARVRVRLVADPSQYGIAEIEVTP